MNCWPWIPTYGLGFKPEGSFCLSVSSEYRSVDDKHKPFRRMIGALGRASCPWAQQQVSVLGNPLGLVL